MTRSRTTPRYSAMLLFLLLAACSPSEFETICTSKGGVYIFTKGQGQFCFKRDAFIEMTLTQPGGGWK